MTPLYRMTGVEPPDFGPRTLWTTGRDRARELATLETGEPLTGARTYEADVDLSYERRFDVAGRIERVREPDDFNDLMAMAATSAPAGCLWVQLTDHDRSWNEALLYLGDEPLPARPFQN